MSAEGRSEVGGASRIMGRTLADCRWERESGRERARRACAVGISA